MKQAVDKWYNKPDAEGITPKDAVQVIAFFIVPVYSVLILIYLMIKP